MDRNEKWEDQVHSTYIVYWINPIATIDYSHKTAWLKPDFEKYRDS